ncbi:MAG: response regulator transcription factor [Acidobacteriota bacterium]
MELRKDGRKGDSVRVLVVDDYKAWHHFVSRQLQEQPELQVIANANDGVEGVEQARQLQPDLILLDIGLPRLNGIEAARQIRQVSPKSKILFTSENRSREIAEEALSTGAKGYVVKSDAGKELLPAINEVLRGKQFVSASLNRRDLDTAEPARCEKVVVTSSGVDHHELRLCADDAAFVDGLAQSIEAALDDANASVVIATEPHLTNLVTKLMEDAVDVNTAVERRLLFLLDASHALSSSMVGATDVDQCAGIPHVIVEAVRTAKQKHLHVAVG